MRSQFFGNNVWKTKYFYLILPHICIILRHFTIGHFFNLRPIFLIPFLNISYTLYEIDHNMKTNIKHIATGQKKKAR